MPLFEDLISVLTPYADKLKAHGNELSQKVDGAYVDDGYLNLTANGEVVAGPLGPFSGGGGGGGGSTNAAVFTVANSSGWLSKTISNKGECQISVTWSSIEEDIPTGNGTMRVLVNGTSKGIFDVAQGTVTKEISSFLTTGSNAVRVSIADVYGNSRTINYSITVVALTLSSSFDTSMPFSGKISFPYVPTGAVLKTTHFIVDGVEIGTAQTATSGRQQTFVIPAQTHGAHSLLVYFDATIDGQLVTSNSLYFEFTVVDGDTTNPVIASTFTTTSVTQYTLIKIPYTVFDPSGLTTRVVLAANGVMVSEQTVDRSQQVWTYRANTVGDLVLTITCGSTVKEFDISVEESDVQVEAETNDLVLFLSGEGRSNNESDPSVWSYGDISASLTNFNFSSDGWQRDADNATVLRVSGDARVEIPYKPFENDFRVGGKTIEVEFATRDVLNYDSVILSCMSNKRGLEITAQKAILRSEQSELFTQYKENEHVRVSFVVEKKSENRLVYIYINGIVSGVIQYPEDDDFSQASPIGISIGSSSCTIDIYNIRVYDNDLTRYQILNNWIADTQNVEQMLERYLRNDIYDEYGNVVISKLPSDLPYMILSADELPQYKGDKKTIAGSYVDPSNTAKSFTFSGAQFDVQGTSSQYYARKNYKGKFKKGFVVSGETKDEYAMNDEAIATNVFCFKADVASSEGANNVELVRLYNDVCPYKTLPQTKNAKIRQGIDGFPIVIFHDDGEATSFIGKYNFNNDKSTEEIFGFDGSDESWEVRNNTSNRVLFKSADYTGEDWLNDFEARYPDTDPAYADPTKLSEMAAWVVSTDTGAATGTELEAPVTYDGVEYTLDTAAYRLAKFKAEFEDYFDLDSAVFYYLFTELFLMVDSRAKNMFPTIFMEEEENG